MDAFEAVETHGENHVAGWVTASDGARLWVNVHGTGRPVVLVHGWTMSSLFWRRQLCLADRFQIVTVDLRGHGRSRSILRGHTVPRYAQDVREVMDGLALTPALLLGWSMGGSVVLEYWREFGGDRLSGLCLVETGPYPLSGEPWNTHRYRDNNEQELDADLIEMTRDRTAFGTRFVNAMFLSGQAPSHAMQWMLAEHLATDDVTAAAIYRDYTHRDYTPVLPTVTVPALAVYGRSRHMCFGASTGRYVAGSIPTSRFAIMEKSGHLPFYEEADQFNETLASFINQTDQ